MIQVRSNDQAPMVTCPQTLVKIIIVFVYGLFNGDVVVDNENVLHVPCKHTQIIEGD